MVVSGCGCECECMCVRTKSGCVNVYHSLLECVGVSVSGCGCEWVWL